MFPSFQRTMSLRALLFASKTKKTAKIAAWLILIASILGTIDATFILLQYIAAIATDGAPTPCSPSSIVNCTKTVQGVWGHVFVIPNPILGMLWYSGWSAFGLTRVLGTEFSKNARIASGIMALLGIAFSYLLFFASLFSLRGVCPFCLMSTTLSTIITLAFLVDESTYAKNILTPGVRFATNILQLLSFGGFVIGLPIFLAIFIPPLLNPIEALTHWSFPVMILLILVMAAVDIWAYRILRKSL